MAPARPLRNLDPSPPTRVRVRFIGPSPSAGDERDVDDEWYALGGHKHPDEQQQERERMAGVELGEWLAAAPHPTGEYVVVVAELDDDGGETGHVWACVKVQHKA